MEENVNIPDDESPITEHELANMERTIIKEHRRIHKVQTEFVQRAAKNEEVPKEEIKKLDAARKNLTSLEKTFAAMKKIANPNGKRKYNSGIDDGKPNMAKILSMEKTTGEIVRKTIG